MDTHTALRRAAKLEYAVLRTPLHLVDERVVQRYLDTDSPLRQSFERVLDVLDGTMEKYLQEPRAAQRRDGQAGADTADVITPPTADESSEQDAQAEAEQIDQLTDELLEEEETETFVGELAEDDDLRQVQAELQAKRLIEEQQEGR